MNLCKVIIVEGRSDKTKIETLINEAIEIICTNGTINTEKLENIIEEHQLDDRDVYILADADEAGEKLRKQFRRELPTIEHIYIDKMFKEVAAAPKQHLATALIGVNIDIHSKFLMR